MHANYNKEDNVFQLRIIDYKNISFSNSNSYDL